MELEEYFKKTQIPKNIFAEKCGMERMTIYRIAQKKFIPSLKNALKIEYVTKGLVTAWDLLPEEHRQEIRKHEEKKI